MDEQTLIQNRLRSVTARLHGASTNSEINRAIGQLHLLETEVNKGAVGHPAVTQTAFPLVGYPLAEVARLVAAMLLTLIACFILKLLNETISDALRALIEFCRKALEKITQARERVKELEKTSPNAPSCKPQFDEVHRILNTMATRLNSPVAQNPGSAFLNGLLKLANELLEAMQKLLECTDPQDSSGLMKHFFDRNTGLITKALRIINGLIRGR